MCKGLEYNVSKCPARESYPGPHVGNLSQCLDSGEGASEMPIMIVTAIGMVDAKLLDFTFPSQFSSGAVLPNAFRSAFHY